MQEYREARNVLVPLFAAVELLGLLRGLASSGLFELTQTPTSEEQVSALLKMDSQRAMELCNTLFAHGVFVKEDGKFRLAERWRILTAADAVFAFQNVLDGAFARSTALYFAVQSDADFWSLAPAERVANAKFGSIDPLSPHSPQIIAAMIETNLPELHAVLVNGGNYLELGCGVGGGLLSTVRAYANIMAVGVELAPDLIAVATQRAHSLGVNDRVTFWQGDAQNFTTQREFDYVWWSQFFFPPATRSNVIKVALRALKPGGYLIAPVMGNPSLAYERLESDMGQMFMRNRVLFGAWGIPAIGIQELQQELEAEGFRDVNTFSTPMTINPIVVGRKPST